MLSVLAIQWCRRVKRALGETFAFLPRHFPAGSSFQPPTKPSKLSVPCEPSSRLADSLGFCLRLVLENEGDLSRHVDRDVRGWTIDSLRPPFMDATVGVAVVVALLGIAVGWLLARSGEHTCHAAFSVLSCRKDVCPKQRRGERKNVMVIPRGQGGEGLQSLALAGDNYFITEGPAAAASAELDKTSVESLHARQAGVPLQVKTNERISPRERHTSFEPVPRSEDEAETSDSSVDEEDGVGTDGLKPAARRLIVAAHRLPVVLSRTPDGEWRVRWEDARSPISSLRVLTEEGLQLQRELSSKRSSCTWPKPGDVRVEPDRSPENTDTDTDTDTEFGFRDPRDRPSTLTSEEPLNVHWV